MATKPTKSNKKREEPNILAFAFKSDEGGGFAFLGEFFRTLTIALRSSGYFITEFLNL